MAWIRRSALLSMLVAGLVFAGSATAHELEMSRANKANKSFAKSLCAVSNNPAERCVSSAPGPCVRISDHRVRCLLSITLELEDKSQGRCLALIEWYIRNKSPALYPNFLGTRSCKQVKPPAPAPVP
jgi:hypothetical protein